MAQHTHARIFTFINSAHAWLETNKEETKFRYAVRKVLTHCLKLWDARNEAAEDLSNEHCAVDKDGVVLRDGQSLRFTKEEQKTLTTLLRELQAKPVEVAVYMGKNQPKNLSDAEREAFSGFVIPETEDVEPDE